MAIENMTNIISNASSNVIDTISNASSGIINSVIKNIIHTLWPILAVIGGLIGLYIIYKIISGILGHVMRKRIKNIEKKVEEIDKKVDEIILLLKNKPERNKKKLK